MKTDTMSINPKDKGHGFYVIGMYPTANPVVMYTGLFTGAKDIEDGIKFAKKAFIFDDRITRVEVQGKKSFIPYFIVTVENGEYIVTPNNGDIKSKSYYSTSILC